MASPGKSTAHCDAGPSSEPSAKSNRPTYADALKLTHLMGSNIRLKQSNESQVQALLQDPHSSLSETPLSTVSVVQKVFDTPELLAMILAKVPLASDRSAMSVSKQFWEILNPDAERHLYGIKEALGLKFSRSPESMTDREIASLHRFMHLPWQLCVPRNMNWLVNVQLDCTCPLGATFLKLKPFVLDSTKGYLALDTFQLNLTLNAEDIDGRYTEWKGVGAFRHGREKLWSNGDLVSRNWMDLKLLKFPFMVQVSVAVDFRAGMGAPYHLEGPCNVQGCQVGLHGVQYTTTTFEPEKAKLGNIMAFLDMLEKDTRDVASSIARRSLRYGPSPHGEAYYLGSSVLPPRISSQYTDEYIVSPRSFAPSSEALEQMTPRRMRNFSFQSWPLFD